MSEGAGAAASGLRSEATREDVADSAARPSEWQTQRVAELVSRVTEGQVGVADALVGGASLSTLGLDSLGLLRLIDAIEVEYGVEIDLSGTGRRRLDTVDEITMLIGAADPPPGAGAR